MYEEAVDEWTDLSSSTSSFPGAPRSFGYGVVLNELGNTKAYLGFGASATGERLADWWEFDMSTHAWRELADFSGPGRRHPSVVPVLLDKSWQIHVGLGDGLENGVFANFNDYWAYDIDTDTWSQLADFPSSRRHHPFFFGLGSRSYTGLGHSDGFSPYVERDWYSYHNGEWQREADFASYTTDQDPPALVTTEARVAGTEFSIELNDSDLSGSFGFVLSGDGEDHGTMATGEFHSYDPVNGWRQLPPHPGQSRWAPGSFVMRGTARACFTSGYNRATNLLYADLWCIDLSPLFSAHNGAVSDITNGANQMNNRSGASYSKGLGMILALVGALLPVYLLFD